MVEFTLKTDDFGEGEFKNEIEQLIKDIDPSTELLTFTMREMEGGE